MPVLHSTKNLEILTPPTSTHLGVGIFEYTDRYSLFHYGPMPDEIPGKGEATARMAAHTFTLLQQAGIPTHFRRFMHPNRIEFDLAPFRDPAAEPPVPGMGNYLIPVQVLLRNILPRASSVHTRIANGELKPADLGMTEPPTPGAILARPVIEYTTTREPTNRFLSRTEAQRLAGLDGHQFQAMRDTALRVNQVLTDHARQRGLSHADGKLEFLITTSGNIVVADSPGTPDESRLMFAGVHCGKQLIRNWYVRNNREIPVAALTAQQVPREEWPIPARMPPEFLPPLSDLYRSLSDTWIGEQTPNVPDLHTAIQNLTYLIGQ